jgi:hypothetical protein
MTISTEKIGARIYVTGNTFPVKNQLKAAGCHWDGDRKQWWIGAAKAADISSIVGNLANQPAPKEDLGERRVYAKVEYKKRTYYVIAEGADRVRLTVLDGSIDFWADKAECNLIKEYQPRQVWDGRRYSNNTVTRYTTLGSLRDFIAQRKKEEATVTAGGVPDGWCVDLEDGCLKPRHECDIPAN